MPKSKVAKQQRHEPLYTSIEESTGVLRSESRSRKKRQNKGEAVDEGYIDSATSRKILELAKVQQQEIEQEEREYALLHGLRSNFENQEIFVEEEDEDEDEDEEMEKDWSDDEDLKEYNKINWDAVPEDADPRDLEIFGQYIEEQRESGNWANKIMERVNELQTYGTVSLAPEIKDTVEEPVEETIEGVMLPDKVIQVYTQIGTLLSRYRSGKLPRAFKIVPTLKNWRDIVYVMDPEQWSSQAIYEATKLFVANMPTNRVHGFIKEVLLPKFRNQVKDDKAVNYHVYRALKKALFKPQAFFKGLLFPLLRDMQPSNREAIILSSVLAKTSVPVLHSAAALMFISEMPYSTANTIVIKVLLDKKYALPYKVVDAMVFYFARFRTHADPLPLVWHQCFLCFCQRYKNDITEDQRDTLMAVTRIQPHSGISPEIRRELLAGEPRIA